MLQSHYEFRNFVERNELMEIPTGNGCFTWTNCRKGFGCIAEKLDRFFFRDLKLFPFTFESKNNSGVGSNHFLVQL